MEEVSIDDDDVLYRRLFFANVYPDHHKKSPGKVNSTAFTDYQEPQQSISVEIAKMTTLDLCIARGRKGQGVGALRAGAVRALGLTIRHDREESGTDAHALIEPTDGEVITMHHCKELAGITDVIRKPESPM
jgi:hypothetical protein